MSDEERLTILLIEPVEVEGDLAFKVSYGEWTHDIDIEEIRKEHDVHDTIHLNGPRGMPIELHLCGEKNAPSAVYAGPVPVFCSIIMTGEDWGPFHCEDCATIVCNWFSTSQGKWENDYDKLFNGPEQNGSSKRLN